MSPLLACLALATRWAVAVVPVDPADAELAQNLSGVLEAQVTELSGAPVAAGEELRARLGLSGRGILGCVGEAECLQRAGRALAIERMVVVIVSRGVGDEYLLDMKLVEVAGGTFVASDLRKPKGVEALIRDARDVMASFIQGRAPAPAAPTAAPAPETRPETPPRRWLPILTASIGVALVGTGVALALSVGGDYDHLKQTCAPSCKESAYSDLRTRAQIGDVLIGVGAAAAAAGAVWWFLQPRGPREPARAWIAPSAGGFAVGGTF
jgi:hypothetical protein